MFLGFLFILKFTDRQACSWPHPAKIGISGYLMAYAITVARILSSMLIPSVRWTLDGKVAAIVRFLKKGPRHGHPTISLSRLSL